MNHIHCKEHDSIGDDESSILTKLGLNLVSEPTSPKYLNLHTEDGVYMADYFIGVDWLKEGEHAIIVRPKIDNIHYLRMFMGCLNTPEIAVHLNEVRKLGGKIYEIFLDKQRVKLESDTFELTPFLIIHFLNVVKGIVKKGLKKGYITVEENLTAKVKGKILVNQTIRGNHFKSRADKAYCQYQKFTIDCDENRLLKKALVFVNKYLAAHNSDISQETQPILNFCLSAFVLVGEEVDYNNIKHLKHSNFFREYKEGLQLAKMILANFSYSMNEASNSTETNYPPFYINMPLLFELYVYSRLKEESPNSSFKYQFNGGYDEPDILDKTQKRIIDAKYKNAYINGGYNIEDIRQLSGYARNETILMELELTENDVAGCLIIYPNQSKEEGESKEHKIKGYIGFKKRGINLPLKS